MSLAHIPAGITVGSAQNPAEEGFLHGDLPFHIDRLEEGGNAAVGKHLAIQLLHGRVYGGLPAETIIQCGHFFLPLRRGAV